MVNRIKNIAVVAFFAMIIFGFMLLNIIVPDSNISYSERRRLKEVPAYSLKKLFNGDLFEEFEDYFLDQFVYRDAFRGFKAVGRFYILNQKDNNNIYIVNGSIEKMVYPLNESSVINAAKKLNGVYNRYLENKNVNYAIIPDKNYFLASDNGYLSIDYKKMLNIMQDNVINMNYIDLFDSLTIDNYYNTDIHWKQEKIISVADKLLEKMRNNHRATAIDYNEVELYPFYGSYYGQAALKVTPDTLVYLNNSMLEDAVVYDHQLEQYSSIYNNDMFYGVDPYDVFLSGARPLLSLENPSYDGKKELLLFRDSFGSSIAPLLLAGYSKITLVDLRYISTDLLEKFLDFSKYDDVLFLYNTLVLNNSAMLK